MKRSPSTLIGHLVLILCAAIPCSAKEWRGIVPLHSTRSDVIRLLGEPKHLLWDYRDFFMLEDATVTFTWVDPTCARKYPVEPDSEVRPGDLVLSISVIPRKPLPRDYVSPSSLKLISISCLGNSGCIYSDDEEGFSYSTSGGVITSLAYVPTEEEWGRWVQGHKACRSTR